VIKCLVFSTIKYRLMYGHICTCLWAFSVINTLVNNNTLDLIAAKLSRLFHTIYFTSQCNYYMMHVIYYKYIRIILYTNIVQVQFDDFY
jgi:hypothetical protein